MGGEVQRVIHEVQQTTEGFSATEWVVALSALITAVVGVIGLWLHYKKRRG